MAYTNKHHRQHGGSGSRTGDVFPMHHKPYLPAFLKERETKRLRETVTAYIERGGSFSAADLAQQLTVDLIVVEERVDTKQTWSRAMTVGQHETSALRRGLRPGQSDVVEYPIYEMVLGGSHDLVTVGINGGHRVDPMFAHYEDGIIEVKTAPPGDAHRDELFRTIESHIESANKTITTWNDALESEVSAEVDRQKAEIERSTASQNRRAQQLEDDGFIVRPRSSSKMKSSTSHTSVPSGDLQKAVVALRTYQDKAGEFGIGKGSGVLLQIWGDTEEHPSEIFLATVAHCIWPTLKDSDSPEAERLEIDINFHGGGMDTIVLSRFPSQPQEDGLWMIDVTSEVGERSAIAHNHIDMWRRLSGDPIGPKREAGLRTQTIGFTPIAGTTLQTTIQGALAIDPNILIPVEGCSEDVLYVNAETKPGLSGGAVAHVEGGEPWLLGIHLGSVLSAPGSTARIGFSTFIPSWEIAHWLQRGQYLDDTFTRIPPNRRSKV